MDTLDWEDILRDIAKQRAVLFIGQDFLPHTEETIFLDLYKKLTAFPEHGIDYFYPHDGFFLFSSTGKKNKARSHTADFYKNIKPDPILMQKITEIPFRMIINVNPDKNLVNAFRDQYIEPQFDYFTCGSKKPVEIVEPTADFPLIYNLFGSIDKDESLVLDYEDLFDYLTNLLSNLNVPQTVQTVLKETRTYIFLGTRLEKWYSQLLFRYLNKKENHFDDSNKNYTMRPNFSDGGETETFFKKQFNVNYFGIKNEFLNDLHQRYAIYAAEQHNEFSHLAPRDRVKRYLEEDKTQLALQVLTAHQHTFSELDANALILIKGNFVRYRNNLTKKMLYENELNIIHNQIKHAVLDFSKILDHG